MEEKEKLVDQSPLLPSDPNKAIVFDHLANTMLTHRRRWVDGLKFPHAESQYGRIIEVIRPSKIDRDAFAKLCVPFIFGGISGAILTLPLSPEHKVALNQSLDEYPPQVVNALRELKWDGIAPLTDYLSTEQILACATGMLKADKETIFNFLKNVLKDNPTVMNLIASGMRK